MSQGIRHAPFTTFANGPPIVNRQFSIVNYKRRPRSYFQLLIRYLIYSLACANMSKIDVKKRETETLKD